MIFRRRQIPNLLEIPEVLAIAQRENKTAAQILLRWLIQYGVAVIPKSTNPTRLRQNLDIFDFALTDADMNVLYKLDRGFRVNDFSFFPGFAIKYQIQTRTFWFFISIVFFYFLSVLLNIQSFRGKISNSLDVLNTFDKKNRRINFPWIIDYSKPIKFLLIFPARLRPVTKTKVKLKEKHLTQFVSLCVNI